MSADAGEESNRMDAEQRWIPVVDDDQGEGVRDFDEAAEEEAGLRVVEREPKPNKAFKRSLKKGGFNW